MQLFLESGVIIENPSDEEIAGSLPAEEFGIISDGPDSFTYLQFAESKVPPWDLILEYQVDSLDNHFRAVNAALTIEDITTAFQKYANGDGSWKTDFQWERVRL